MISSQNVESRIFIRQYLQKGHHCADMENVELTIDTSVPFRIRDALWSTTGLRPGVDRLTRTTTYFFCPCYLWELKQNEVDILPSYDDSQSTLLNPECRKQWLPLRTNMNFLSRPNITLHFFRVSKRLLLATTLGSKGANPLRKSSF